MLPAAATVHVRTWPKSLLKAHPHFALPLATQLIMLHVYQLRRSRMPRQRLHLQHTLVRSTGQYRTLAQAAVRTHWQRRMQTATARQLTATTSTSSTKAWKLLLRPPPSHAVYPSCAEAEDATPHSLLLHMHVPHTSTAAVRTHWQC
jgi:hypothetical protein